ncbi:hypothetical protein CRYUN_Cryun40dG0053200 [Craigia yunnanensis]
MLCCLILTKVYKVDSHKQQLDQYLKKSDEELRHERENAAATPSTVPSPDGTTKSGRTSESGRGGRKKTRLTTAAAATAAAAATEVAAAAANPTGMELDLPVDPNEPTYCLCIQVSYGEMVACDNPDTQKGTSRVESILNNDNTDLQVELGSR